MRYFRFCLALLVVFLFSGIASAQLAVSVDQAGIHHIVGTSTLVIPVSITLDGEPLPAGSSLSDNDFTLTEMGEFGGGGDPVYGAPNDCDKIYHDTSTPPEAVWTGAAESRFHVMRVNKRAPILRLLFLIDESGSMAGGDNDPGQNLNRYLEKVRASAKDIVNGILANGGSFMTDYDAMVNVATFQGTPAKINMTVTTNPAEDPYRDSMYGTGVDGTYGWGRVGVKDEIDNDLDQFMTPVQHSATALVKAVRNATDQLKNEAAVVGLGCDANEGTPCDRPVLKVLITYTDGSENTSQPAAPVQPVIAGYVNNPDWAFISVEIGSDMSGTANAVYLGTDLHLSAMTNPENTWTSQVVNTITSKLQTLFNEENKNNNYYLYYCSHIRAPQTTSQAGLQVTSGGQTASTTFTYQVNGLVDGCYLGQFDQDRDCFLDPRIDADALAKAINEHWWGMQACPEDPDHPNQEPCETWSSSDKDLDCSGCLDNNRECRIPTNCTTEACKFPNGIGTYLAATFGVSKDAIDGVDHDAAQGLQQCDRDPDPDWIELDMDHCRWIHQSFVPNTTGSLPEYFVNPEPPSTGYYCENDIDEDCDGVDTDCPMPPAPDVCSDVDSDGNGLPAESTLNSALNRTNVYVIPDVRRGLVAGENWKTDITLIADGPAPGDVDCIDPCQYHLNCRMGADNFYHAVACPTASDITGDRIADTCGFCFTPEPWVELFFIPGLQFADTCVNCGTPGQDAQPVLSRKFCLDGNGALRLSDVLKEFGVDNTQGSIVVSTDRPLIDNFVASYTGGELSCPGDVASCYPTPALDIDDTTVDAGARTYIDSGFGKRVSAIPSNEFLGGSATARLIHLGGSPTCSSTVNLGITNINNAETAFDVRFFNAAGVLLNNEKWNIPAHSTAWKNSAVAEGYDVYVTITVIGPDQPSARFVVWASNRDDCTGDPAFVDDSSLKLISNGQQLIVPDVMRVVQIVDEEYWQTDIEIANAADSHGATAAPAEVTYWLASDPTTTRTVRQLEADATYRLRDILPELGLLDNVSNDSLVFQVGDTDGNIAISGHTYNLKITPGSATSETFGEMMAPVAGNQLFGVGTMVSMPGFGGNNYSSEVYVTNPSSVPADVIVEFWGAKGYRFGTATLLVAPNSTSTALSAPGNRAVFTATVKFSAGSTSTAKVFAYEKITDPVTSDVMILLAR